MVVTSGVLMGVLAPMWQVTVRGTIGGLVCISDTAANAATLALAYFGITGAPKICEVVPIANSSPLGQFSIVNTQD